MQCADSFEREKYNRVSDLTQLSIRDVVDLCPGLPHGTAATLLSYAKKDTDAIRRKEMKYIREAKKHPRSRY
ncbi:hypothetical protein GALMADRAFT_243905, partial [Galerina marginata CBS 339.88]